MPAFLDAVLEIHSQILDYTKLSRRLNISRKAARRRIEALEAAGLILLLPAFAPLNGGKIVRSPRLYVRDTKKTRECKGASVIDVVKHEREVSIEWILPLLETL